MEDFVKEDKFWQQSLFKACNGVNQKFIEHEFPVTERSIGTFPLWKIRTETGDKVGVVLEASPQFARMLNEIPDVKARERVLLATASDKMSNVMQAFRAAQQGDGDCPLSDIPMKYYLLTFKIGDHRFDPDDGSKQQVQNTLNDTAAENQDTSIYSHAFQNKGQFNSEYYDPDPSYINEMK